MIFDFRSGSEERGLRGVWAVRSAFILSAVSVGSVVRRGGLVPGPVLGQLGPATCFLEAEGLRQDVVLGQSIGYRRSLGLRASRLAWGKRQRAARSPREG